MRRRRRWTRGALVSAHQMAWVPGQRRRGRLAAGSPLVFLLGALLLNPRIWRSE